MYDREQIKTILPHRDPFLLVDEIVEIEPGRRIVGLVHADPSRCLARDGSGRPCFPASLLTEAMAQIGAILVLHPEAFRGKTILFRAIDRMRFRRPVPAGTSISVQGEVRRLRGRLGSLTMKAYLGQKIAAEGIMAFALSD